MCAMQRTRVSEYQESRFLRCTDHQLLVLNLPTVVLIKVLECGVEVLLPVHSVHVHCRGDELLVVDQSIAVGIGLEIKRENNL